MPSQNTQIQSSGENNSNTSKDSLQLKKPVENTGATALSKHEISSTRPIQINLDTPTDWAAAVITPIVIALVAAWFTWINQRFQVRSSTANFRHAWQTELRASVTNYIGNALEINMRSIRDPAFLTSPESEPLFAKLSTARATIRVMLDKNKSYTLEMIHLMDEISDGLDDNGTRFSTSISRFTDKSQEVLEIAWMDIRRDLTGKRK